ncbi:MAG: Gfo/Idh/MocA family oxidoreductase [Candidatus Latescibacteria bacterium]|nr:Gfo/Idh/MocA family oxidoreductase [Candidatus Latescibacterota bacterium]
MKPVRLGFIGLGHISTHAHLPGLAPLVEAGEVVLQAFCDVSEENVKKQAEVFKPGAVYTHPHAMLEQEDLDAVYVCIPPTLHTDEILIAAGKGMAVFVEKPQSLDMAQAVRFDAAIRKAGVVSQVGFMSRYYPSAEKAHDLLKERTARHAQVQLFYSGKPVRYWTSRYELCGGSFVENTIHTVDLLRYFLGDITHVSAFYVARKPGEGPEPMNLPHVYNVNYRFAGGATANCTTSRVLTNVKASRREVLVVSDDSLIEWSGQRVVENGEPVYDVAERVNPFALQARAFVEAVRAGDPGRMRSSYENGMNSLASVLGANASAERGGQVVALEDFIAGKVSWTPENSSAGS